MLIYIEVDGNNVMAYACIEPEQGIILYNGQEFSYESDGDAIGYAFERLMAVYNDSSYDINFGEDRMVTPPVDVPIWVGDY